jgi:hypothetical protein
MVRAGRIGEVAQYCEADVANTYRLWLVYELFRGAITTEQLTFSEAQRAEFIRTRKADNPHLSATLGRATETGFITPCLRSMAIAKGKLILAGDSRERSTFGGQKAASTLAASHVQSIAPLLAQGEGLRGSDKGTAHVRSDPRHPGS